jgi:GTP-binding protein
VGLPNAGKSTLLAAVSAAKPKIADYPFTTLHPQLGVVRTAGSSFVLADIPGLIAGAHAGHGLGTRFLGHIERCAVLLHLIDVTGGDAAAAYRVIRKELKAYSPALAKKPEIIAFNKIDANAADELAVKLADFKKRLRKTPILISGATGKGVDQAMKKLLNVIGTARRNTRKQEPGVTVEAWRP